jgi:outer membrane protein
MTKNTLRSSVLLLAWALLFSAPTVSAADVKIGYVSPARVTDEAPQAEAARSALQDEFEPRNQELIAMRDELRRMEDRMLQEGTTMSEEAQQRLQREIVSLRRDLQRAQEAFREDLNMRRNEELANLQRRIVQTIGEFARDEGYDLIVSDGVLFASDKIDITDHIVERLRAEFQQRQQ